MTFQPRFGQAAEAYQTFRPEYPPELFERILAAVGSPRHRAVDLGSGTGHSARPLCRWFIEVIAVEPDPLMAARLAGTESNLVVRQTTAEECVQQPESVDLVTAGTAFHWMDGPRVLENILAWLRPCGVLAAYFYGRPETPESVRSIVRGEFKLHWDAYYHDRLRDEGYSQRTIEESEGWSDVEGITLPFSLRFTPQQIAGFWSSTSYCSAYMRTLADPEAYRRELERRFREASPDGIIPVEFRLRLILARKA